MGKQKKDTPVLTDEENASDDSLPNVIYADDDSDDGFVLSDDSVEPPAKRAYKPNTPSSDDTSDTSAPNSPVRNSVPAKITPKKSPKVRVEAEDLSNNTVYLIRKPIEVSVDDLKKLKFNKIVDKKISSFKTDQGDFETIISNSKNMLLIPCPTIVTSKDARNIKASDLVSQQITIQRIQPDLPGDEENGKAFKIKSIRKKPILKMDNLEQRLKAYGVWHKKSKNRRSLKNLKQTFKEERD